MSSNRIQFPVSNVSALCFQLESDGYKEHLNTFEKLTVYDDENMNHIIYVNTEFNVTADIYYDENKAYLAWGKVN